MTSIHIREAAQRRLHIPASLFLAAFAGLYASSAAAQQSSNVTGVWYDSAREGAIEVAPCGKRMCGNIVWLKSPLNAEGKPLFDRHNPSATKQSRLICGLQVLRDLQPLTDGSWGRGIVYDPKKGAENEASIKPLAGGKLQLTGYGLFGLSKSFEWTRAPADLQKCGNPAGQAAAPAVAGSAKTVTAPAAAATAAPAQTQPQAATQAPASGVKPAEANAAATGIAKPAPSGPLVKPAEVKPKAPAPKPSSAAPSAAKAAAVAAPANTKTTVKLVPATASATTGTSVKPKPVVTVQKKAVASPSVKAAAKPASTTTVTAKPAAGTAGTKVIAKPATTAKAKSGTAPVEAAVAKQIQAPPVATVAPSSSSGSSAPANATAAGFAD